MAFMIYVAFVLLAVVGRMLLQYKLTGDSGVRMVSKNASFLIKFASFLFVASLVTTFTLVTMSFIGVMSQDDFLSHWVTEKMGAKASWIGGVLGISGTMFTVFSQHTMGRDWRVGVDESEPTGLITHGIYRYVRNPIYTGVYVFGLGVWFLLPGVWMSVGVVMGFISIELQVRFVEEPHLRRLHGVAFEEYQRSSGRYFPKLY